MPRSSSVDPRPGGDGANSPNVPSSSDRQAVISDCRLPNAEEQEIGGDGVEDEEEEYEEIEVEVYEEVEEEIEVEEDEEEEVEEEEEEEEMEEVEEGEEVEVEEEEEVEVEDEDEEEEDKEAGEGEGTVEEKEGEDEVNVEVWIQEKVEEEDELKKEDDDFLDKSKEANAAVEVEEEDEPEEEDMPDTSKEVNVALEVEEEDEQEEEMSDTLKEANVALQVEEEDGQKEEDMPQTLNEANVKQSDTSQVIDFEETSGENGIQVHVVGKSAEESMMKESSEEISRPHNVNEAHLHDSEAVAVESNNQLTNVESNALAMKDCFDMRLNSTMSSQEEAKSMEMSSDDYAEQPPSRVSGLITSEMSTQNLCPSSELKGQSKCPEVICDFFAKGWCIRGTSCRFLHINSKADNTLEGESEAAFFSKSDQIDKGLRNVTEKPKVPSNHDLVVSSIGNDDNYICDSMERIFQLANKEKQRLHQLDDKDNHPSLQQEGLGFSSPKDIGIPNHRQNWHSAEYGSYISPINRGSSLSLQNSLLPEHRSYLSGSAATLSSHHGLNSSSYSSSLEHQIYLRSRSLREAKFGDSISSSHKLSSHHLLAWTGSPGSFGSEKLLGDDNNYNASRYVSSIDRGSSPSHNNSLVPERRSYLSGSGATISKYHGLNSSSCSSNTETQTYMKNQSVRGKKVDDFLTSSCVLPSHQSTWTESSFSFGSYLKRSPSDFLKMLPDDGDHNASRLFSFPQRASLSGSDRGNLPFDSLSGDLLSYGKHKEKISSDKWDHSVPFQPSSVITPASSSDNRPLNFPFGSGGKSSIDILNQPVYSKFLESGPGGPQIDTNGAGTVTGENCVVGDNGSNPDEEIGSSNVHQKDAPNAITVNVACDSTVKGDGHKHKKVKVSRESHTSEMEVDKKSYGESKTMRQFRVSLVDAIKELLKPAWHDGHLSKDAHNTIVKKAEEKVLSSLEPHQIPSTMESIKQYLSASQPKLAKLVEGYCAKYEKS